MSFGKKYAASQLGVLEYKGTWNASTNLPALTPSVGDKGDYYIVSVAGTTNLNGITDWQPGDWVVFSGTEWQKLDNSDEVRLNSPAFTGTPTAPTPASNDNSTKIATTAFVQTGLNTRQLLSEKNAANGYAGLDATTKLLKAQLPAIKFTELSDTETTYAAKARFIPTVNDSETGLRLIERKALFSTTELILNPSFEDWPSGFVPTNWTYTGTGSTSSILEKVITTTFNGGTSLRMKSLTGTYANRRLVSATFQVPASGDLVSSIYGLLPTTATAPTGVFFRVNVFFYNSSMQLISTTSNNGQSFTAYNTWITFNRTNAIPAGAAFAQTFIEAQRSGTSNTDIIFDFASTVVSSINVPSNISDLTDVDIVNAQNKDVLVYDSAGLTWRNNGTIETRLSSAETTANSALSTANVATSNISSLTTRVNSLEDEFRYQFKIERITLTAQQISNGYIDLTDLAITNSVVIYASRTPLFELFDFTKTDMGGNILSGPYSRLTFINDIAVGGLTPLIEGDVLTVYYAKKYLGQTLGG